MEEIKIEKTHLFWIIPVSIIIGMVAYSMMLQHSQMLSTDGWVSCLNELDNCEDNNGDRAYYLGLVRGCDIGCIDYNLKQNNYTWQTTEEEYNILDSENYLKCSDFCQEHFGGNYEN